MCLINTAPTGTQRICNIYSPNFTTDGGMMRIPSGTQNVILYCICWRHNVAVGPSRWFMGSTEVTHTTASGNHPYTRGSRSIPGPLIIPSFTTSHVGTYTCTSDGYDVDTATIDLALAGMCNCNSLVSYIVIYCYVCVQHDLVCMR